jgi:hypothetical protein
MMQEHLLIGRITRLQIFKVPEFGTRASFSLQRLGQGAVTCSVAGNVAREFVTYYGEGDFVAVNGFYEPRPSTASPKCAWAGRFRVCALRALENAESCRMRTCLTQPPRIAELTLSKVER